LLSQILVFDPNLRLPIAEIKNHKFFGDITWKEVEQRKLEPVPFKPNPLKYRYLLSNKYNSISSLHGESNSDGILQMASKIESPKKNLLGDFTLYKVNKEFENF